MNLLCCGCNWGSLASRGIWVTDIYYSSDQSAALLLFPRLGWDKQEGHVHSQPESGGLCCQGSASFFLMLLER